MREKDRKTSHRLLAGLLCVVMVLSLFEGTGLLAGRAYAAETPNVNQRVADPDTMDTYTDALLSTANGSRYAGRVWTDKTVFAYQDDNSYTSANFNGRNTITLDMNTDGYESTVDFNTDFAHVFSALASSQVVNEYPPSPIDLVIVFDMSGSMGQDTRYDLDLGQNIYVSATDPHYPPEGVPMQERIANSRVQATLTAINKTIDGLMAQNPQNRVAVCAYGANATVILPLAHYRHKAGTNTPYLSVGGMETLYHPSDLVYKDGDWYWMNNRDTCYTVVVSPDNEYNTYTGPLKDGQTDKGNEWLQTVKRTVSNNVRNEGVKAFPGVATQTEATLKGAGDTFGATSVNVYDGRYAAQSSELKDAMASTQGLAADDYVGYFTNTQGGIYLAYKQLADSEATTYSETLQTTNQLSTVARIPAAIIMSDGGANFAFNEMGEVGQDYTAENWYTRYGQKDPNIDAGKSPEEVENWYINDNSGLWGKPEQFGRSVDFSHRLGLNPPDRPDGNVGDEWYNVYLPGTNTLGSGWNGLHSVFNVGADYYKDGTLSTQPQWNHAGVLYSNDRELGCTAGTVLEVLLTAAYMNDVVKDHYEHGWEKYNATMDSRVPLSTYTMNVDTRHVPQWGRWRLYPSLDPQKYPLDGITDQAGSGWNTDVKKFGEVFGGSDWGGTGEAYINGGTFTGLKTSWEEWKGGAQTTAAMSGADGNPRITISPITGSVTYAAGGGGDVVTTTHQDVIDNIAYDDEFYDVTSEQLGEIFGEILTLILGKVFVPVSGSNDAGVGDAVTYQDPIGDLMEVKSQSITAAPYHIADGVTGTRTTYDMAMLLFGEMHGMVRTGVYDFQWNDTYVKNQNGGVSGAAFSPGWYKGDPKPTNNASGNDGVVYGGADAYPGGCSSAADAWAQGWVYRFDFKTAQSFVPILKKSTDVGGLSEAQRNTVFTMYRFACDDTDRNLLRRNPVYGAVPDKIKQAWDAAVEELGGYPESNAIYASTPGVYRLSDIRVWVEEYGDYRDDTGASPPCRTMRAPCI